MKIEDTVFQKCSVDFKKLAKYGFKRTHGKYFFEKLFHNGEFKAEITVTKTGEVQGKVFEIESSDEFLPLRVQNQEGCFVCGVREEYKKILTDIKDNCFSQNYFIFPQSNRIANAIFTEYGDNPDFMWKEFDGYGVFKNADTNKWYGIIMNIDYSKLGGNNKNPVEVINLKLNKDEILRLQNKKGFYPAWHMNKKFWITITLDETLSDETILKLVKESYSYSVNLKKRS